MELFDSIDRVQLGRVLLDTSPDHETLIIDFISRDQEYEALALVLGRFHRLKLLDFHPENSVAPASSTARLLNDLL